MLSLKEFSQQLEDESLVTRKMLDRVPSDNYDWQPHPKSMTMRALAGHIAELPGWVSMAFTTDELDFAANAYQPIVWNNNEELLANFEQALAGAKEHLNQAKEEDLLPEWLLRNGEEIYSRMTKGGLMLHSLYQTIHHRAQLGVYLRLLDIPIPGTYGPSADEQNF
jgi:uncharacterized damage-inducible protein DinB